MIYLILSLALFGWLAWCTFRIVQGMSKHAKTKDTVIPALALAYCFLSVRHLVPFLFQLNELTNQLENRLRNLEANVYNGLPAVDANLGRVLLLVTLLALALNIIKSLHTLTMLEHGLLGKEEVFKGITQGERIKEAVARLLVAAGFIYMEYRMLLEPSSISPNQPGVSGVLSNTTVGEYLTWLGGSAIGLYALLLIWALTMRSRLNGKHQLLVVQCAFGLLVGLCVGSTGYAMHGQGTGVFVLVAAVTGIVLGIGLMVIILWREAQEIKAAGGFLKVVKDW